MFRVKAPKFWARKAAPPKIFQGISIVYQVAQCLYEWNRTPWTPFRMKFPVISMGALSLGGAGKTPCTLALAQWVSNLGYFPIILTRGYAGRYSGPLWVESHHTPYCIGEEAWMMAQYCPVLVAKDILKGAQYLHHTLTPKNTVVIWDDGHQYPKVYKDIAFIVTNTQQWFGNRWVFPAGLLRESLESGIQRCDGIICLYAQVPEKIPENIPIGAIPYWPIQCKPVCTLSENTPVIGFCGLGNPERFWNTLAHLGLDIKAQVVFPDHHYYTAKDEAYLGYLAQKHQAVLITSHKDYVKLSPLIQTQTHQVFQCVVWSQEFKNALSYMLHQYRPLTSL